jgi:hypothetical protein
VLSEKQTGCGLAFFLVRGVSSEVALSLTSKIIDKLYALFYNLFSSNQFFERKNMSEKPTKVPMSKKKRNGIIAVVLFVLALIGLWALDRYYVSAPPDQPESAGPVQLVENGTADDWQEATKMRNIVVIARPGTTPAIYQPGYGQVLITPQTPTSTAVAVEIDDHHFQITALDPDFTLLCVKATIGDRTVFFKSQDRDVAFTVQPGEQVLYMGAQGVVAKG